MGGNQIMQDLFNKLKQNKSLVILVVFLAVASGLAYWWTTRPYNGPTGGSGKPAKNTVAINGWNKKSKEGIEIGSIISDKQQQQLQQLLSEEIVAVAGEFDYLQSEIQDDIESFYDKETAIDQTTFTIKTAINNRQLQFTVILDHNADMVKINLQTDQPNSNSPKK